MAQLLFYSFLQDSSRVQREWRVSRAGGRSMSGLCISIRLTALMFLWKWLTLSLLQSWVTVETWAADPARPGFSGSTGSLGWLLSDKGPFHHSQEFLDFTERYQQGFTTKYKIYRWEKVAGRIGVTVCTVPKLPGGTWFMKFQTGMREMYKKCRSVGSKLCDEVLRWALNTNESTVWILYRFKLLWLPGFSFCD